MLPTLTPEQILALAPDSGVAQSGRGLATPRKWSGLGHSEIAAWGECQGSGKDPYKVQIDLREPAFRCSCPSRKFPCKHGIALLLLLVTQPAGFGAGIAPAWVSEWLAKRGQSAEKKSDSTSTGPTPKRAAAQTRAAASREAKVGAGVDDLARWLRDQVRQGLASAQSRPTSEWNAVAARMIDAQAPGLARIVREIGVLAVGGEGWQDRMLERMARLHLLLEGYRRIDTLPAALQIEVRTQIGWSQDQEMLRARPGVRDQWLILGQRVVEEEQLRAQRSWLWGLTTNQPALLLSFAPPGQPLDRSLVVGTTLDAELAFFDGVLPLRALVKERHAAPMPIGGIPAHQNCATALAIYGTALASNPWLDTYPLSIDMITPLRADERWFARDRAGHTLPLRVAPIQGWRLLAISAGQPLTLFGEWDGDMLTPLSAWVNDDRPVGSFHLI